MVKKDNTILIERKHSVNVIEYINYYLVHITVQSHYLIQEAELYMCVYTYTFVCVHTHKWKLYVYVYKTRS